MVVADDGQGIEEEDRAPSGDTMGLALYEFENRLRRHLSLVEEDAHFWKQVAHDLHALETHMDAAQVQRFEIWVDHILSMLGLTIWSIARWQFQSALHAAEESHVVDKKQ